MSPVKPEQGATNEEIEIQLASASGKRRGNYSHYDYKQQAKVDRHANKYG